LGEYPVAVADDDPSTARAGEQAPEPEPNGTNGEPEEFSRFEDLMRRLARVSKSELDAKRKPGAKSNS
jgi:hypothetical protein